MTRIRRDRTNSDGGFDTCTGDTCIVLRTCIAVVTRRAVGFQEIRTRARHRITNTR